MNVALHPEIQELIFSGFLLQLIYKFLSCFSVVVYFFTPFLCAYQLLR